LQGLSQSTFDLLGIRVDNLRLDDAIHDILRQAEDPAAPPRQMCFVNAHCVNVACTDPDYAAILLRAGRVFADGIGVKLGARVHGVEVVENVNGTDLFPRLCEALGRRKVGLYLLGARPGVVDGVVAWLRENHPTVRVKGSRHGYFTEAESEAVADDIRASGAEILLVAMGVPRQEKWIETHLARSGARVALGVGALFDFYSRSVPRAPAWMRERGLEWVYRLYQEPGRLWKRYVVGNPQFLWRVVAARSGLARIGITDEGSRVGAATG
jgi:N-acetylglucosaminyldiphosphoundecaprenol N-acetyl-beta-D-mannosaminyltransferase